MKRREIGRRTPKGTPRIKDNEIVNKNLINCVLCGGVCVWHIRVCTDAQKPMAGSISLSCSPPYFLGQGLKLNLELTSSARLAGQSAPGISLSLPPQSWDFSLTLLCLAFYMVIEDPKLGPQMLYDKMSTFPNEPSPKPFTVLWPQVP